jgi:hypothetical protein
MRLRSLLVAATASSTTLVTSVSMSSGGKPPRTPMKTVREPAPALGIRSTGRWKMENAPSMLSAT